MKMFCLILIRFEYINNLFVRSKQVQHALCKSNNRFQGFERKELFYQHPERKEKVATDQ